MNSICLITSKKPVAAWIIHKQAITCMIHSEKTSFAISIVYGSNDATGRRKIWDHLLGLRNSIGHTPWIILGDFKAIRNSCEKIQSSDLNLAAMSDFNECIEAMELQEFHNFFHLMPIGVPKVLF